MHFPGAVGFLRGRLAMVSYELPTALTCVSTICSELHGLMCFLGSVGFNSNLSVIFVPFLRPFLKNLAAEPTALG